MVIPTSSQPLCTACCSALPEPYSSPATANVRSAAAWKSESACSRVVSVTYQMRPAFSQDVHTAVVVSRVQIIRHVGRLRILPELRIVVSRTGIFHGTQRDATYAWHEQPGADQPIGFIGSLAGGHLFYQRAEHVGHGLVQRAGLSAIAQPSGILRDPCVSSWPTTSIHFVKRSNNTRSPSP